MRTVRDPESGHERIGGDLQNRDTGCDDEQGDEHQLIALQ